MKIVKRMDKERPIDYQMFVSVNTTATDSLSISSTSPTIPNTVDNRNFIIQDNDLIKSVKSIEISMASVGSSVKCETVNRNNLSLDTSSNERQLDERNQQSFRKLTPVHHHPLMMLDSFEDEDSLNNSNTSRNFPDVVPTFAHPRAPESNKISLATADLVNSVNNNNNNDVNKIRAAVKPFYREPSPVSNSCSTEDSQFQLASRDRAMGNFKFVVLTRFPSKLRFDSSEFLAELLAQVSEVSL